MATNGQCFVTVRVTDKGKDHARFCYEPETHPDEHHGYYNGQKIAWTTGTTHIQIGTFRSTEEENN